MVEEKTETDDFNLDDFNFDDLLADTGEAEKSQTEDNALTGDDFAGALSGNTAETAADNPFNTSEFEEEPEKEAEAAEFENEVAVSEEADTTVAAAEDLSPEVEASVVSEQEFETADDDVLVQAEPESEQMPAEELEAEHQEFFEQDTYSAEVADHVDDKTAQPAENSYVKWYSGHASDKMFEISKGFDSGNFDADEECKTIHVNVGYDTYGWEVQFADGVVMNLRDVREYQIRNGRLPSPSGRIIYGRSTLLFSGVERIVVYESVKYFSYGI